MKVKNAFDEMVERLGLDNLPATTYKVSKTVAQLQLQLRAYNLTRDEGDALIETINSRVRP